MKGSLGFELGLRVINKKPTGDLEKKSKIVVLLGALQMPAAVVSLQSSCDSNSTKRGGIF